MEKFMMVYDVMRRRGRDMCLVASLHELGKSLVSLVC